MVKKAKVTYYFRHTVLHDHAASRLVKNSYKTPFFAKRKNKKLTKIPKTQGKQSNPV